jgi:hypothetical protein
MNNMVTAAWPDDTQPHQVANGPWSDLWGESLCGRNRVWAGHTSHHLLKWRDNGHLETR